MSHNGEVIDSLLLQNQVVSKPWILGFWVEEAPILDEIPIKLVHSGDHRSYQDYSEPQVVFLPSICNPRSRCHHR